MPSGGYVADRDDFLLLNDSERAERTAALGAISLARRTGMTVESAAAELGVGIDAVHWWAEDAIGRRTARGTYPTSHDRIYRMRPMAVDGGEMDFVDAWDSDDADEAQRIFGVQWDYVHGNVGVEALRRLPKTFLGRRVVRDPRELEDLARRREFNIEEIYRWVIGA